MTRIAYFVHDLNDAAVARRCAMLGAGGADVVVAGFSRDAAAPAEIAGCTAINLGQTGDAQLVQRAAAVLRHVARPAAIDRIAAGADVLIGRNLEALALAARARRKLPQARLVYECLDIHRTLLGTGAAALAIQAVEAQLLHHVDQVLVSSPAFAREYFARRPIDPSRVTLVENKLWQPGRNAPAANDAPRGPPWTIGWFGMLRCRRSLAELAGLAARHGGLVEVLIAGKPSPAEFADFEAEVATAPHCRYVGPYRAEDLPALYGQCHFAWAVDWFEEGLNSAWLLPNRLYEASSYGVVPIALAGVETGRWLAAHEAGVRFEGDPVAAPLDAFVTGLDADSYSKLRGQVAAIPLYALTADTGDAQKLVAALARP
jgi:succinoglycan biosynthesis protein ExoL